MTEKQFIVVDCSTCVFDKITKEEYVCIDKEEAFLVCDRFNKFVDENEKLKQENKLVWNKIKKMESVLPLYLSCKEVRDFHSDIFEETLALTKYFNKRFKNE